MEKIQELPEPTCVKELRQLIGVIYYYCRYIPNLSTLARPMFEKTKKDHACKWGVVEAESLGRVKAEICREEALAPFETDLNTRTYLTCDASQYGMGTVLEQDSGKAEKKKRRPIFYW